MYVLSAPTVFLEVRNADSCRDLPLYTSEPPSKFV